MFFCCKSGSHVAVPGPPLFELCHSWHARSIEIPCAPCSGSVGESYEDDGERANAKLELVDMARWIEALEASMNPMGNPGSYSASTLFSSVLLFSLMRHEHSVEAAIPHVARVIFPTVPLAELHHMVRHSFPRGATLLRAGVILDCSYTLWVRKNLGNSLLRYAMGDSSPQCGREWFMQTHTLIECDQVIPCCQAANQLARCHPERSDHEEAEMVDVESYGLLRSLLAKSIQEHRPPPLALGATKTAVEDKADALLFSAALECTSRSDLRTRLSTYISWTLSLSLTTLLLLVVVIVTRY